MKKEYTLPTVEELNGARVYTIGPYSPYQDAEGVWHYTPENVFKAEQVMYEWSKAGHMVYCPQKHSAFMDFYKDLNWKFWMKFHMSWLETCGACAVISCWVYSPGSKLEIDSAMKDGKLLYYQRGDGSWRKE